MLMTSRWVDGREAVSFGLASRCYPAESLHDSALALASQMASQPPEAVAAAKRLIRSGRRQAVQEALVREREEAGHLRDALGPLGGSRMQ
jgi:enoyl-CoA hydratase/carnithine racemase